MGQQLPWRPKAQRATILATPSFKKKQSTPVHSGSGEQSLLELSHLSERSVGERHPPSTLPWAGEEEEAVLFRGKIHTGLSNAFTEPSRRASPRTVMWRTLQPFQNAFRDTKVKQSLQTGLADPMLSNDK